uniref:Uncharacterized protein n=1 Tax=Fundulus heteroclitus TaxID=8078 RepID=A0A3Q2PBW0_FUNHE
MKYCSNPYALLIFSVFTWSSGRQKLIGLFWKSVYLLTLCLFFYHLCWDTEFIVYVFLCLEKSLVVNSTENIVSRTLVVRAMLDAGSLKHFFSFRVPCICIKNLCDRHRFSIQRYSCKKIFLHLNLKSIVCMSILKNQTIKAANGKSMKALKVFTEVLQCLKDDALKAIMPHATGGKVTASDFIWVLTVPALWGNPAKQFMREAATQAGIITDGTKGKLLFALESEAALAWCLKLPSDGFITQNQRDSGSITVQSSAPRESNISSKGTVWITITVCQTNIQNLSLCCVKP